MFWNLNYWDSVSTMAGEVDRPGTTLPKALVSAVSMTSLGYLLPLMAATGAIDVAPEDWGNGFFADAAGTCGIQPNTKHNSSDLLPLDTIVEYYS